jgi:hypothetical protein
MILAAIVKVWVWKTTCRNSGCRYGVTEAAHVLRNAAAPWFEKKNKRLSCDNTFPVKSYNRTTIMNTDLDEKEVQWTVVGWGGLRTELGCHAYSRYPKPTFPNRDTLTCTSRCSRSLIPRVGEPGSARVSFEFVCIHMSYNSIVTATEAPAKGLLDHIVIAVEKPQNRLRHNQPVVHPLSPFSRFICNFFRQCPTLNPQFQLPLDHGFVELHMALGGKQSLLNIHPLDAGVVTRAPHMNFGPGSQQ